MNRRSFFARAFGAIVAAAVVPWRKITEPNHWDTLTYRGVPVMFDEHCPKGMVYFINPKYLRSYSLEGDERLAEHRRIYGLIAEDVQSMR